MAWLRPATNTWLVTRHRAGHMTDTSSASWRLVTPSLKPRASSARRASAVIASGGRCATRLCPLVDQHGVFAVDLLQIGEVEPGVVQVRQQELADAAVALPHHGPA